jgi:hypothetical protein
LQKGDTARARVLAEHVQKMPVTLKPGEDNADALLRDLDNPAQGKQANPAANAGGARPPQNPLRAASPGVSFNTGAAPDPTLVQNSLPRSPGLPAYLPDVNVAQASGSSPSVPDPSSSRARAQQLLASAR